MEIRLKAWEIAGFFFVILAGALLHFTYGWSGGNGTAAIFSAVNESTWEHLKLLFWPYLLFSLIEYLFIGRSFNNFLAAKAAGVLFGLAVIIVVFYTYTGITGQNAVWADILLFVLAAAGSMIVSYWILISGQLEGRMAQGAGLAALVLLAVCFAAFTFYPPEIPLFFDPEKHLYGLPV